MATRKRAVWWGVSAVAGVVLAGCAATTGAAAPGEPPQRSLEVFVPDVPPYLIDQPPAAAGPMDVSEGDTLLLHGPVLDPATGQEIGFADTRVQVVQRLDGGDAAFILDCTLHLPGGTIVFYGSEQLSHLHSRVTYAVTGGTGRYDDAAGSVTGVTGEVAGQPGSSLTFRTAGR